MSSVILLTGATGFLGSQIARCLLNDTDHTIVALVRTEDRKAAERRLFRSWWDWPELAGAIGERVEVLCGDVASPRLGLDEGDYDDLVRRITHIIHTAADLRVNAPIEELRRTNVQGTTNVLELARAANKEHGIARFSHVSTAYVAGGRKGLAPEDALTDEFGFSSAYERSKYEGEMLVQEARSELPISVFRPGMIVGDSRTGAIKNFNTLYFPLRLYLTGKLKVLPMSSALRVNLIPVNYVAEAVVRLTFEPGAEGINFHLTAPYESLPTAGELVRLVRDWARERLGLQLASPLFVPLPVSVIRGMYWFQRSLWHKERSILDALISLMPYFSERRQFLRDNVDQLLGTYEMKWRELIPPLLDYAVYMGFLHRSDRTVHEQVIFRLESRSRPVTYHDVVEGKVITRSAADVRRDVLAAMGALRSMGIRPGDRVALVGLNSTRYLTLDVAIGLVGAVSVPLYYTSPTAEVDDIIRMSGSRLLLVGAPKLLEKIGEVAPELPVVSFCRSLIPEGLPRKVMTWDEFLALGTNTKGPINAPVDFGDVATLRYTSGTTGRPRGVIFKHENLRWMAESLVSLLPWRLRNSCASYLSFLPMNHVVEGILGTYSPYYIPAPVDIYFLEDFRALQRTLPRVRPTIFFSVPRFYEKLWEALKENRMGKWYLRCKEGLKKRLLRRLLRRSLLKRAGLDKCAWLLVGSAPPREDVLRAFQELGIEVHNAYGLTEAPLVTINRLGANRVGTVGEPLPNTQVRVAEDGEVMVCGPQVTAGYFDEDASPPFMDGWLLTGDTGHLTREGNLVINGRKKELIKTSYGKYIQSAKVEAMLREISDVSEVMLVGEGMPYCAALLWVEKGHCNEVLAEAIHRCVVEVNARLSHPEQVKRWAILANDLSIENGDLTANLKLKRQALARRLQDVLLALYGGCPSPECVLRMGEVEREG
ncbi:AMP-binding protein [Candidatus Poribacteria bacterium]|nr:AMP-binding protein [Candidatus Poribacteria bacterium]